MIQEMDFPFDLISILRHVERVTVLTGAGVSQESGLRTFRDAQTGSWQGLDKVSTGSRQGLDRVSTGSRQGLDKLDPAARPGGSTRQLDPAPRPGGSAQGGAPAPRPSGLWVQYRPEDLATPQAFARNPKLVWDWYAMRREKVRTAEPNLAHLALARMARFVPSPQGFYLVTQNVDGLHQKAEVIVAASFPLRCAYPIIELHGNLARVRCASCGRPADRWEENGQDVPGCASCGGLLRPDVVWFGEALPRQALEQAVEAARTCQVFFSVGTSGVVQPAASLAYAARNRGAVVVEVNAEPTPLSEKADFALQGKAGEILPALVEAAWPTPPSR